MVNHVFLLVYSKPSDSTVALENAQSPMHSAVPGPEHFTFTQYLTTHLSYVHEHEISTTIIFSFTV